MLFVESYCADTVEQKQCDITKGEQMSEEFIALNPLHQIPTMQVGKEGIFESNAILRYLASTYKPEMYPTDPLSRAKVDMALDWNNGNFCT